MLFLLLIFKFINSRRTPSVTKEKNVSLKHTTYGCSRVAITKKRLYIFLSGTFKQQNTCLTNVNIVIFSMSTLIEQTCTLIKNFDRSVSKDQLKDCLDTIVTELNKSEILTNATILQEIVTTITLRSTNDRLFSNTNLLDHQLFVIICHYYFNLLCQWRTGQLADSSAIRIFSQIAVLFYHLCSSATNTDVEVLKSVWINEPLINEICTCLKEIGIEGKHIQDEHVQSIDYFLRGINHLEKGRIEIQNLTLLSKLRDQIVSCVCSSSFIKIFNQLGELKNLNASQTLLLETCTDMISWYDAPHYNQTHIAVRTTLLNTFNGFLKTHLSSFQKLNEIAIKILGQLSITLIGGNAKDEDIFPPEIRQGYCTMIDLLSTLLNSIVGLKSLNESLIKFTRVLTQCLYSLTMTNDLRTYIKTKQIVPLLLKLTYIEDETVQFHVYRILAAILTEEDIRTLANPQRIAHVFLNFFGDLIDDSTRIPRFFNLLRSLKSK